MPSKKKEKSAFQIVEPKVETPTTISLDSYTDTPLFCFKYFNYDLVRKHKKEKTNLCYCFLERLQKLSEMGWKEIRISKKHSFGMEKLPKEQIKIKNLPIIVTPDVQELHVFRATGDNLPFIGLQDKNVFHVFFIEPDFGVLYNH